MRTRGLLIAGPLPLLTVGVAGVGVDRAGATERMSGSSGVAHWKIVDVIQTRLPEEQAVRWDYVVVLTGIRAIQFSRVVVGESPVSRKFDRHLAANAEIRVHHWDRTPSGANSMVARRRYYGKDDAGYQFGVEVRFNLDPTVGERRGAASMGRVASPTAGVPLPWDARIVPPGPTVPRNMAALSGLWVGKWDGVRDHVLVVEEVGERDAFVTYAVGTTPKDPQPGWMRARARLQQGRLTFAAFQGDVSYRLQRDGRLLGIWTRGGEMARVTLTQPVAPAPAMAGSEAPAARAGLLAREAWQDLLDGRYAEALPKAQQALALREQLLGADHLDVAVSLNLLGEVYRAQGRLDDAERVHRRALTIREQRLGPDDPEVATTLNNLAMLQNARVVYAEAESLLRRALQIVERARETPQQNRRLEAEVLENLAKVYRALGRTAEAEESHAKAMMLWTFQ